MLSLFLGNFVSNNVVGSRRRSIWSSCLIWLCCCRKAASESLQQDIDHVRQPCPQQESANNFSEYLVPTRAILRAISNCSKQCTVVEPCEPGQSRAIHRDPTFATGPSSSSVQCKQRRQERSLYVKIFFTQFATPSTILIPLVRLQGALLYPLYLGNISRYNNSRLWVGTPRKQA